jgi:hypothetical protein
LCAASIILFSSCATILQDDSQPVAFSSDPQGAIVSINGMPSGTTPCTIMVRRSRGTKMIELKKDGYQTVTMKLEESIDAAAFGNIVLGGVIGGAVDAISGKGTNFKDTVQVKLVPLSIAK